MSYTEIAQIYSHFLDGNIEDSLKGTKLEDIDSIIKLKYPDFHYLKIKESKALRLLCLNSFHDAKILGIEEFSKGLRLHLKIDDLTYFDKARMTLEFFLYDKESYQSLLNLRFDHAYIDKLDISSTSDSVMEVFLEINVLPIRKKNFIKEIFRIEFYNIEMK